MGVKLTKGQLKYFLERFNNYFVSFLFLPGSPAVCQFLPQNVPLWFQRADIDVNFPACYTLNMQKEYLGLQVRSEHSSASGSSP